MSVVVLTRHHQLLHDLLVQPTRADQVCMVLHALEREFPQGVDTEAIKLLCCTGEQAEVHLTVEGQALWELLTRAEPSVRSEGHAAYANERATNMTDRSQSAGASSTLLGMCVMSERRVPSSTSSDAPASDACAAVPSGLSGQPRWVGPSNVVCGSVGSGVCSHTRPKIAASGLARAGGDDSSYTNAW